MQYLLYDIIHSILVILLENWCPIIISVLQMKKLKPIEVK